MSRKLEEELVGSEAEVPTGRLGRLWRMGRTGLRVGTSLLGKGPSPAQVEAITRGLGELKGLAMKAGQMLSYIDAPVPPELQQALKVLQQAAQASPWEAVEGQLRATLGPRAEALLAGLERRPIAVASIGQVHRGRLPDGTEVAVKVSHPGIERELEGDFMTAGHGTAFASVFIPAGVTVDGFVHEARTMLLAECDYQLEAERQRRFGAYLADDETIRVPAVFDEWSGGAVLTTAWLKGRRFEAFCAVASQAERDRAGAAMFRFHVGELYRHALFHADPHPGNYAFREDGALVIYDFGCVREFSRPIVQALARCADAIRRDHLPDAFDALAVVGATPPAEAAERQIMRELLRAFFSPLLVAGRRKMELTAVTGARSLLSDKRRLMKLRLPAEMLFLFRLRFGLFSVLHHLGAEADWAALESRWASECALSAEAGPAGR